MRIALVNFQFFPPIAGSRFGGTIFNFQSIFNILILKIYNSIKISNFKFKIIPILLLLSILYFLSSPAPTYAASQITPSPTIQHPSPNTNPDVPNNLHNWTQNVMIEVMSSLICQLAGVDPINPKQGCLGIDPVTNKIGFLQKTGLPADSAFVATPAKEAASAQAGGAIGFMGDMIATLYTPPLHTGDYFQNLAQNFGINKKAYAQSAGGTGFQGLTPLIGIWSAFRNIVYLILVIVFVVIGLAIMLRIKIDPRTVMTIQNQIPKIIIGILVVTFSFAIAGFLVDLMWVSIYLIYGIFSGIQGVDLTNLNPSNIQGQTALRVAQHMNTVGILGTTWNVANSVKDVLKNFMGVTGCTDIAHCFNDLFNPINFVFDPNERSVFNILFNIIGAAAGTTAYFKIAGITDFTTPVVGDLLKIFAGQPLAITGGIAAYAGTQFLLREFLPFLIVYLIIFIALLVALFRLWFTLIMAYVHILIDVVLAPFWIIGGIVPGSPISLSGWLRDLIANLAAFPAVIGMFLLGKVFMDAFGKCPAANPNCSANNFVPPLIGNPGDPSLIGSLIGLGIILMTPNVVNMLKTALKAPKLDTGLGKAIGAGAGVLGGTTKSTLGAGSAYLLGDPLTGKKGAEGLRQALTRKLFG